MASEVLMGGQRNRRNTISLQQDKPQLSSNDFIS